MTQNITKKIDLDRQERILVLMQRSELASPITKRAKQKLRLLLGSKIGSRVTRNFLLPIDSFIRKKIIENSLIDSAIRDYRIIEPFLPKAPKRILDIGSGMGIINLLVYEGSVGNPEIWLLDKEGESDFWVAGYRKESNRFSHYNSFNATIKQFSKNGISQDKIKVINISENNFPIEASFDIIYSFLAWGFHFSVEAYLHEAYQALKSGGTLILDIRDKTEGEKLLEKKFGKPPSICFEGEKFKRMYISK